MIVPGASVVLIEHHRLLPFGIELLFLRIGHVAGLVAVIADLRLGMRRGEQGEQGGQEKKSGERHRFESPIGHPNPDNDLLCGAPPDRYRALIVPAEPRGPKARISYNFSSHFPWKFISVGHGALVETLTPAPLLCR